MKNLKLYKNINDANVETLVLKYKNDNNERIMEPITEENYLSNLELLKQHYLKLSKKESVLNSCYLASGLMATQIIAVKLLNYNNVEPSVLEGIISAGVLTNWVVSFGRLLLQDNGLEKTASYNEEIINYAKAMNWEDPSDDKFDEDAKIFVK